MEGYYMGRFAKSLLILNALLLFIVISSKLLNKFSKVLLVVNTLLFVIVMIMVFSINKPQEIDYDIISNKVVEKIEQKEDLNYDRIEEIVREIQQEKFNDIEEKVQSNYEEKDFGEKFEEVTTYFGDKLKETFINIDEKINK